MIIRISLPEHKKGKWENTTHDFASKGAISHNDLAKLIGGLSFAQTSVFGRFGRTLLTPLRDRLKRRPYVAKLPADEVDVLRWRVTLRRDDTSRVCVPKLPCPEVIIYTDAATSARIAASLVVDVNEFEDRRDFRTPWAEASDPQRGSTFILTTYIYGLEILATLAAIFLDSDFLRGKRHFLHRQF